MKLRPKLNAFRDLLGNRAEGDGYVTPGNTITRAIYDPIEAALADETPLVPVSAAAPPAAAAAAPRSSAPAPAERAPAPVASTPAPAVIDGYDEVADAPWTPPAMVPLPETEHEAAAILADPEPASPETPAADERAA